MDIVIVAQYLTDITKPGAEVSRFLYLAKLLGQEQNVEIVTTDFIHQLKQNVPPVESYEGVKLTMLHEPGYPRNICLTRFKSHMVLAKNVAAYLTRRKKPDVLYCAVPSLDVASAVAKYCRRNHVRLIVDIQDLWPEAFKMVLKVPVISDLIFYPMSKTADAIYSAADEIVSVSESYAARAKKVSKKKTSTVVFLGTDKNRFDSYVRPVRKDDSAVELVYVGSLEKSYDLENVIRAVAISGKAKLVVIGDGSKRQQLEQLAREQGISCEFTGRLAYPDMVARMCACDIAVNPIRRGSAGSVINKVGDYAMAGLPVINTQECQEYRSLLEAYEAGLNCRCEDPEDIARKLDALVADGELRCRMAKNSRKLGEEKFDRRKTYQEICRLITNDQKTQ